MLRRGLLLFAVALVACGETVSVAQPVYVSYVDRPTVRSPDGKWELVVSGPRQSLLAWVTLEASSGHEAYLKWPLQRGGWVLWRPDSKGFALTDAQFANHYFIDVFSTTFHMSGVVLGSPITSLSPALEKAFDAVARAHYSDHRYLVPVFYPKAIRWLADDRLLIVLSARTSKATSKLGPLPGIKDWYLGFLVDVPRGSVVTTLTAEEVRARYGINLPKDKW